MKEEVEGYTKQGWVQNTLSPNVFYFSKLTELAEIGDVLKAAKAIMTVRHDHFICG
jgi:hypothetical protein